MPWYGAVVWSVRRQERKYCCQWDSKRRCLELPKGGMRKKRRQTSGFPDSSPFATARWEMWEEAGIWLGWRRIEEFQWMQHDGHALPLGPAKGQSAFVVTEFQDAEDYVADCNSRHWLTLKECERMGLRPDHLQLLQRLSRHASEAPEQQHDAVALAITDLGAEDAAGTSAGLGESQEPAARKPRSTKRKRSRSLESSSGEQDG